MADRTQCCPAGIIRVRAGMTATVPGDVTASVAMPIYEPGLPDLWPEFLSPTEAYSLFARCRDDLDWQVESFPIFGRTLAVPRLVTWAGEAALDYRYAGRSHVARGWPAWLAPVALRIGDAFGQTFNHVLLNRYRSGNDYMGWHRDDEKGVRGPVAVLSLGVTRTLRVRLSPAGPVRSIALESGSLLRLEGHRKHTLVREPRLEGERISLSFRQLSVERIRRTASSNQTGTVRT